MVLKFEKKEHNDAMKDDCSTPKLSLYHFPSKKREPLGMLTPPMPSFASIPFKWEEAPGKPRTTAAAAGTGTSCALPKSKAVRCLVPPPRLMNVGTSKVTNMPSPTTVLDEPFSIGRSFSSSGGRSFWSPEGDSKERFGLSSSCRRGHCNKQSRVSGVEGSMDFSSVVENSEDKVRSTTRRRMKRRSNSFLIVSSTSSKVLSSLYESFKQAVPWKRIPEKIRKKSS
ncbi:putative RWP-RK domain-containing protein [Heracleum sosnowskyi]|uniref:RWP-RK domain-containing protein n=1 Tax=Heracleum sosnowskyi TaxID=360622 RepID=A0AAD8HHX5_9APIA|nr:putative RWP-RK domain-containing protein [Heracleum sosnowskyi]